MNSKSFESFRDKVDRTEREEAMIQLDREANSITTEHGDRFQVGSEVQWRGEDRFTRGLDPRDNYVIRSLTMPSAEDEKRNGKRWTYLQVSATLNNGTKIHPGYLRPSISH